MQQVYNIAIKEDSFTNIEKADYKNEQLILYTSFLRSKLTIINQQIDGWHF